MALPIKELDVKVEDLSSIPGNHMEEVENQPRQCVFWPSYAHGDNHTCEHNTHTQTNKRFIKSINPSIILPVLTYSSTPFQENSSVFCGHSETMWNHVVFKTHWASVTDIKQDTAEFLYMTIVFSLECIYETLSIHIA